MKSVGLVFVNEVKKFFFHDEEEHEFCLHDKVAKRCFHDKECCKFCLHHNVENICFHDKLGKLCHHDETKAGVLFARWSGEALFS